MVRRCFKMGLVITGGAARTSLGLLAMLASTHVVCADDTSQSGATALFQKLDANGDGSLSADEVEPDKRRLFERLTRTSDRNGDGKLSRDEFVAGLEPGKSDKPQSADGDRARAGARPEAEGFFRRMDRNGDGRVTADEIPAERREGFERMLSAADRNGDASLSIEEFSAVRGRFGRPPGDQPQPGDSGGTAGSPLADAVFRALDRNGDGQLSSEEVSKASDALTALDKNGDGQIAASELTRGNRPAALAAAGGPNPERAWKRLLSGDTNNDGKLSQDEVPERMKRAFGRIDRNGDGQIDQDEFQGGLERLRAARPAQP